MAKIGFCCKWIDEKPSDPKASKLLTAKMNQRSTTQTHMRGLPKVDQFTKLFGIVTHNCDALWEQLKWIATQPEGMRLFRITSEFLPLYTLKEFNWLYAEDRMQELISERLRGVRRYADDNKIRLCTHPGQFTNLCSDKPEVVKASIVDFEYHAMLAAKMGYGDTWHSSGFAINIHANYRQDPGLKNIRRIIANDLSNVARNLITLENDEYSCSVDEFIESGAHEDVALVLDIHHHWVESHGDHISVFSDKAKVFYDSWRGMRPLGHMSMPAESVIPVTPTSSKDYPDYKALVAIKGISSSTLRAHSFDMWNESLRYWASTFALRMDIEVEAKGKNIASRQLYDYARDKGLI